MPPSRPREEHCGRDTTLHPYFVITSRQNSSRYTVLKFQKAKAITEMSVNHWGRYLCFFLLCTNVHDNVKLLLTGIVAVSRVDNAKHIVSSCLLLTVPVLVDKPSSTAPLPQFREDFPLQKCKMYKGYSQKRYFTSVLCFHWKTVLNTSVGKQHKLGRWAFVAAVRPKYKWNSINDNCELWNSDIMLIIHMLKILCVAPAALK